MAADEARKQSRHHAFSGDCQFFFAVGVSNAGVHIGEFAGSPQWFSLREGSIVLSTETGIKCFGAAFWKFRLQWSVIGPFPVSCARRFSSKRRPNFCRILAQLRHTCVTTGSGLP